MGNAATRSESNVIGRQYRIQSIQEKRPGATRFAPLFFFFALLTIVATNSLAQDLSGFAEKLRSGNVEEKREALFQIRNLRSQDASRAALPALQDKTPIVRATAASSVIFLPTSEASAALLPLLGDKDEFVRREGAYALGEVGDVSTGRQLITALANDKSPEVKTAVAVALGKVGDPAAVPALVKIFDTKPTENNETYRRAAARSIGQIAEKIRTGKVTALTPQNFLPEKYKDLGQKPTPDLLSHFSNAVKRLIGALESSSEADDTRREAAFALGAIGNPSAETILSKYTSGPDPYLAEICNEAIMKLKRVE